MKKPRSTSRHDKRAKRTRHEQDIAMKVGKRFWEKCQEYEAMTIEELDAIKSEKRSATDAHAYSESYRKVKKATVEVAPVVD
jgi:hypothetical protein